MLWIRSRGSSEYPMVSSEETTYQVTLCTDARLWSSKQKMAIGMPIYMLLQVAICFDVQNNLDWMNYLLTLWEFNHSSGPDSEHDDGHCSSTTHLKM